MRLVFGLVLVVGLGLAGFAVYMAKNYIGAYQAELAKERAVSAKAVKTVGVYVAKRPLKYGEPFTAEDVALIDWPEKYVPEGAFTNDAPVFAEGVTDPRYVIRAMEKYEPLLALKVSEPGQDTSLTSRLGAGKTAFTMKVDAVSGVSGFLRPGDNVDVYWTGAPPAQADLNRSRRENVTRRIVTNVEIIAVDQTTNTDDNEVAVAKTITMSVTPTQFAVLQNMGNDGDLALALVGDEHMASTELVEVNKRGVLGMYEDAPVAAAVEEKECTTTVNKGTERIKIVIPCT